jgi:hypothetical protein
MLGVDADYAHDTLAVNHLALVTNLFDGRTYLHLTLTILFIPVSYAAAIQIVGRQLNQHSIPRKNPDEMLALCLRCVPAPGAGSLQAQPETLRSAAFRGLWPCPLSPLPSPNRHGPLIVFAGKLGILACPPSNRQTAQILRNARQF